MVEKLLRLPDVMDMTGKSRSAIYMDMAAVKIRCRVSKNVKKYIFSDTKWSKKYAWNYFYGII